MHQRSPEVETFWRAFQAASGLSHGDYDVVSFGDNAEENDELLALALQGTKRATASLAQSYTEETLPRVGGLVVVLDGQGRPRCVWRTTEITVKPFNQVDAPFAWDEGEGDRGLASWLANHRKYFAGVCAANGWTMSDDIAVVFERFKIVYRKG